MRFSIFKDPIPDLPVDLLYVGTVHDDTGAHPLVYRGRDSFLLTQAGLVGVARDDINPVVASEVADRAREVWGQMWPDALALVTGIDRRRLTGVRFATSAIPPRCLAGLGAILEDKKTIKAVGAFVLAQGYLVEADIDSEDFEAVFMRSRKIFDLTHG